MPLLLPQVARRDVAADGSAKYGLRLADGALIEAVLMAGESRTAAVNEFEDARALRRTGGGADAGTRGRGDAATRTSQRSAASQSSTRGNSKFEIRNSKFTIC